MIYLQPWWHSWLQNKNKKIGVGYCNGQPWLWLAAEDSPGLRHVRSICVFLGHIFVFVYSMCMRATIVYIYLCDCIGIFECEAHFNMIIVPASVCGVTRWWGALLVSQSGGFWGGKGQVMMTLKVLRSPWAVCSLNAGQSPVWSWGGVLFDDLGTVAPGFGLSLGQGQPGRLRGHLRRVTGREALWHLLDSRWRRCRVCNLHWNNKWRTKICYKSIRYTIQPFYFMKEV